jgi:hypothetical protein
LTTVGYSISKGVIELEISKRLVQKITDNKNLKEELRLANNKIKGLEDKNLALTNENGELEIELKEWNRKQRDGYTAVGIVNGYVVDAVTVLPNSTFLYTQPIPKEIGTKLYNNIPFIKVVDGKMCIDTVQQKKYKGVI